MIEIKNLRKTYGKKVALKSFSYTFEDGIYGNSSEISGEKHTYGRL